jgi:hypothetical protein
MDSLKPFNPSPVDPPVIPDDDCDNPPCPPKSCKETPGLKEAEALAG